MITEGFRKLTAVNPYEYQKIAMENLVEGKSLIVRAPTGSGKTEIALIPFIYGVNDFLPSQLIYSLPTRTLVESIGERATKYASSKKLRTAIHHGKKATSSLFEEDIIVTTIDQTAGAYLSVPLSMPKRWGNMFVGGVASALAVFDEVHTLDPEKGLQTTAAIAMQSAKLGFPSIIMSATLPDVFIERVRERVERDGGKVEVVDVKDESEIKSRRNRKVELINRTDEELAADIVLKEVESNRKLVVVVNTVERAQKLYLELKDRTEVPVLLLHSRYLEKDRAEKEKFLEEIFGKSSRGECIFISTQVVEVGMDISSPKILSEAAPVDALIQRAGRCARWGGNGELHVFGLSEGSGNPYAPYSKELVESTITEVNSRGKSFVLDWQTEVELVNQVLSSHFEFFMDSTFFYQRLGELARAVYEGSKAKVEQNVREVFSCDVTLHENPESLEAEKILALPKIRVDARVLSGKIEKLAEMGIKVYKLEENPVIGDYEEKYTPSLVRSNEDVTPFELYVLSGAYYSPDVGLVFDKPVPGAVNSFEPDKQKFEDVKSHTEYKLERETWVEHAKNTLWMLEYYLIPRYRYVIKNFANYFGYGYNELVNLIRCITALHDLGKLNVYWQKKVGWGERVPLAHSDETNVKGLPPHATVSARALQPYLESLFDDEDVFKAFYLTIAHHHAPWAREYKGYSLIPHFDKFIDEVWSVPKEFIKAHDSANRLDFTYLDVVDENEAYRLYGLLSKLVRISDRLATGGVSYESIFSA
ncbi:CRISPR-associated helicase/endonuclease Cas3 [Methermicoccus shengliensis]|uniref:CRISPR-associated helicase/endonuclease Cas3 n=1 Tax=Methermicoccus shengliensis TaxID=660064 RepID=UPI0005B296B1|nr:CRISPR-associated helicase/endonuclease Cas3 [Methermicoccus shengliensis]